MTIKSLSDDVDLGPAERELLQQQCDRLRAENAQLRRLQMEHSNQSAMPQPKAKRTSACAPVSATTF